MTTRRKVFAIVAATGLAGFTLPAQADMGTAPVGPQGTYISFEGGYLYQDGEGVNGYGVLDSATADYKNVQVSPDDGYFLGGLIGYNSPEPFFFGFHRAELYLLYGNAEDSTSDTAPPDLDITSVDGVTVATGGLKGRTNVERETWEGGFRFEDDDIVNATTNVTWVFQPFIRNVGEDTSTAVSGCCSGYRSADVDSWLYGVVLAVEPEKWLTPSFALVGRLGAGVYGYNADGKFRSHSNGVSPDPFAASVSDDDSGVGFRGLLGVGLKFKLGSASLLEAFSEVDYFSDVGTAHISSNSLTGIDPSHVSTDDLWELRTGLRFTFGFSGPPAN